MSMDKIKYSSDLILSTPRKVTPEEIDDPTIVIGLCYCPEPIPFGHVFKKSEFPSGVVRYKCSECGAECEVMFNSQKEENDG